MPEYLETLIKDPNAKKDYTIDWSDWLVGDTIQDSAWTVATGLTQSGSPAPTFANTTTTIWLEGGTAGQNYDVLNRITTAAGRIDDRTFRVLVRQQ